mgnify:CR=1 FL=1
MLKNLKNILELTNKYIVLATPLILYSLITGIYLAISFNSGKIIIIFIALFLFFAMSVAFIAGWFKMIKDTVIGNYDENPNSLIKLFPEGVGEYFLPSAVAIVNLVVFFTIMLLLACVIGIKFIGDPGIPSHVLTKAMASTQSLKAFLMSLSAEQLAKLNLWNIHILLSTALAYFLIIFYFPVLFFKTKNPFKAFFIGLKDLFCRKFFITLGVFLIIFISYFIISIMSAISSGNLILHFCATLLNFYYVVVVAVGVFYYYYHNFVEIGKNIDTQV